MVHGELLAPAIREAMGQAGAVMRDLTDVAVGVGPGPFTGLRVGVVTALTLGHTLGLRTHGVCTLDILAAAISPAAGSFLVATDARRREVYWARYDADCRRVEGPEVAAPAALAERFPDLPVYGRGARLHAVHLAHVPGPDDPDAADLAHLVATGAAPTWPLQPLYLRRPDAVPLAERS